MSSAPDKRFVEVPEPTPSFPSGSAARELQLGGVLRVGVVPGTLGFVEQNPKTGRLEGIDIDLADLVAQSIFGGTRSGVRKSLEFVAMRKCERESALEDEAVDIVISTYGISDLRRQRVDFSKPYFGGTLGVLTSLRFAVECPGDLAGCRLGAVEGSMASEYVRREGLEHRTRLYEHDRDMVDALRLGEVDAAMGSSCVLANFQSGEPDLFEKPAWSVEPVSYGIGVSKCREGLRDLLDMRLDRLCDDGTLIEVAQRQEDRRARARRCTGEVPSTDVAS